MHLRTYSRVIREDKTTSSSKTIKFTCMPKLFILIITGEDANAYYFHLEHEAILNRPYCFFTLFYKYICLEQLCQRMYNAVEMEVNKEILTKWENQILVPENPVWKIVTCSCFFFSLNANSAKSFWGTSFSFGRSLAIKIRTCWMGQGGTTSSAIYWNEFVNKWEGIN